MAITVKNLYTSPTDLFTGGEQPTASQWNARVLTLHQSEVNKRFELISGFLTAPAVTMPDNATVTVTNLDAILRGKRLTGTASWAFEAQLTETYYLMIGDDGTLYAETAIDADYLLLASVTWTFDSGLTDLVTWWSDGAHYSLAGSLLELGDGTIGHKVLRFRGGSYIAELRMSDIAETGAGVLQYRHWGITETPPTEWMTLGEGGGLTPGDEDASRIVISNADHTALEFSKLLITPDGALQSIGGDARGAGAIDLQCVRTLDTEVASGLQAVSIGGEGNTTSGARAINIGGLDNLVSGAGAVNIGGGYDDVIPGGITVSGDQAVNLAGDYNELSGNFTAIIASTSCVASADYATARGQQCEASELFAHAQGQNAKAYLRGQIAQASGLPNGATLAQTSVLTLSRGLDGNGVLTLDSQGAGSNQLQVPYDATWKFSVGIVARCQASSESAGYEIKGVITNEAGTTRFVGGTPVTTTIAEDVSAWDANVTTAGGYLVINVVGESGKTIRWVARVELVEVGG